MTDQEIIEKVNKLWGWMSKEDMQVIINEVRKLPGNPIILEIGTGMGRSALLMSLVRPDAQIWTVDAFGMAGQIDLHSKKGFMFNVENKDYAEKIWKDNGATNIHLIVGDCTKIDWDKPVDLLFIDGDHTFVGVKADFDKYSPFVKKDGYLLLHDVSVRTGGTQIWMLVEQIQNEGKWDYKEEFNVGVLTRK